MKKGSETENNLKTIINFLNEAQKIGRPKLSNNKLEKSVSGSKESTFYDHNFSKWHSKKKSVEKKISDLASYCRKQINEEDVSTKSYSKQCKRKDCPDKNKRVEEATKFCSGCGRKF